MKWYYLLASLPTLQPDFQNQPPLTVSKFWLKIQEEACDLRELVQVILLEKDLLALEQVYAKRQPSQVATIPADLLNRFPLEPSLRDSYLPAEIASVFKGEKWPQEAWPTYYKYAAGISQKYKSVLSDWFAWELGLKKNFKERRGQNQSEDVWQEVPISKDWQKEHSGLVDSYYKSENPLEAENMLDKARWDKISQMYIPFSFDTDEIVGYTVKLLLWERWWIISQNEEDILQKVADG